MNRDTFTSSTSLNQKQKTEENNFFVNNDVPIFRTIKDNPRKHINDYDFNLLKEDAYKEVSDKTLKLEYKISKIEDEIKNIDQQIQAYSDINDSDAVEDLKIRKLKNQQELAKLIDIYNESGISAKISGGFTTKIKEKITNTKDIVTGILENFISKLPGKFSSFVEIKQSLAKLENINKSVDELMSVQIPYGDTGAKYDQLSRYIVKANSIQSEISKFMQK